MYRTLVVVTEAPMDIAVRYLLLRSPFLWFQLPLCLGQLVLRDPGFLPSMHPAILRDAFLGGYRAMVVVVYPSSFPSLFPMELAIDRALDPAQLFVSLLFSWLVHIAMRYTTLVMP